MFERELAGRRIDLHPAHRIDLDRHHRLLVVVLPLSIPASYHLDMDASDLAAARDALLVERAQLLEDLEETIIAPDQMTYGSQAAAASQVFAQQRDLALRERTEHQLALVDEGLARIGDGTYGICLECRRPIDEERLGALPWAARCIECQRLAGR